MQDGSYTPLSRPLFIYPSGAILQTDYGAAFVEYYLDNAVSIAETALFVPLTDEQQQAAIDASNALKEERRRYFGDDRGRVVAIRPCC